MYFFKIKQNEDYQNRLHFRELNEVKRSFSQSIGQLIDIAELAKKSDKTIDSDAEIENQNNIETSKKQIEKLKFQAQEYISEINQLSQNNEVLQRYLLDIAKEHLVKINTKVNELRETLHTLETKGAKFSQESRKQAVDDIVTEMRKRISLANQSQNFNSLKLIKKPGSLLDGVLKKAEVGKVIFFASGETFVPVDSEHSQLLRVSTRDFMLAKLNRFPLLLIANDEGKVLARQQDNRRGVEAADLQFNNVKHLLVQSKQGDAKSLPAPVDVHNSDIVDVELGSVQYRVFIQPINLSMYNTNDQQLFVLGLVPANQMRLAKLAISPNTALWFVLLLLGLVALLPLIKLRFVSPQYAFSRGDVSQIGIGLIVVVGVSSIALTHQLFYGFLIDQKVEQSHLIHKQIRHDFAQEITSLLAWNESYSASFRHTDNTSCIQLLPINRDKEEQGVINSCVDKTLLLPRQNQAFDNNKVIEDAPDVTRLALSNVDYWRVWYEIGQSINYVVEGMFELNPNGRFVMGSATNWLNDNLLIRRDVALDHRSYFKHAINCDVWGLNKPQSDCSQGLTLERINNVRDGRKNTQFAIPKFKNIEQENRHILSFGTRLRTFFYRVMPRNYGYMVFDPSGQVLFHSNEERSLIEDVFVETDNNQQLQKITANSQFDPHMVDISLSYRGQEHLFTAGKLFYLEDTAASYSTINRFADSPLTLVVFYNKTDAELNNMLLVMMAVLLFLLLIIPLFMYFRYVTCQLFWASLLHYNPKHLRHYFSWSLLAAAGSIFCLCMMGIVYDLLLRIAVWLVVGMVVYLSIMRSLGVNNAVLRGTRLNLFPIVLFIIVLVLSSLLWLDPVKGNYAWVNWWSFSFGLILFLVALLLNHFGLFHRNLKMQGNHRVYPTAFISLLVALTFFISAVPASLIINSANGYLLQRQAQMQSRHLSQANQLYLREVNDYLNLMGVNQTATPYKRRNWLSNFELEKQFYGFDLWVKVMKDNYDSTSDGAIDSVFKSIKFADSLLADLAYLAKAEHKTKPSERQESESNIFHHALLDEGYLSYLPDVFMLQASKKQIGLISLFLPLQLLLLVFMLNGLLIRRLFGDHLVDDHRITYPTELMALAKKRAVWSKKLVHKQGQRLLVLQSNELTKHYLFSHTELHLYRQNIFRIKRLLTNAAATQKWLTELEANSTGQILIIEGYEEIAFEAESRRLALLLTQQLLQIKPLNIVILSDTAPLYRLIKQHEYPHLLLETSRNGSEALSWASAFAQFEKVYEWTPRNKNLPRRVDEISQIVVNEANAWPELARIKAAFRQYHRMVKLQNDKAEITRKNLNQHWFVEQVVAFFTLHAGPIYRAKWELCTKNERFLLYQLANGCSPNPQNAEVIEHLTRRGYIYRDGGWHIINDSFKRFVQTAERIEDISEWTSDANRGIWSYLRIPIFTLVLVLVVVTVFSSGQAIDSAIGILTAILGLLPLLLRNISLVKGGSGNIGQ